MLQVESSKLNGMESKFTSSRYIYLYKAQEARQYKKEIVKMRVYFSEWYVALSDFSTRI